MDLQQDPGVMGGSGYTHSVPWGCKVEATFFPGVSADFTAPGPVYYAGHPEVEVGWFIQTDKTLTDVWCFGDTATKWLSQKRRPKALGKATTTMRATTHVQADTLLTMGRVIEGMGGQTIKNGHLKRYYDIGELYGMQKGVLRENPAEALAAGYGTSTLNASPTQPALICFYTQSPGVGTVPVSSSRSGYYFPMMRVHVKLTYYVRFYSKLVFTGGADPGADLKLLRAREEEGELDAEANEEMGEEWCEE